MPIYAKDSQIVSLCILLFTHGRQSEKMRLEHIQLAITSTFLLGQSRALWHQKYGWEIPDDMGELFYFGAPSRMKLVT